MTFIELKKASFRKMEKEKPVNLLAQIKAVEAAYEITVESYTDLIGPDAGTIPAGRERDEANGLRCALRTLKSLKGKRT